MAELTYEWCVANAEFYMMFGDCDKPFHRPECECVDCERWRISVGRPTHAQLRGPNAPD